MVLETLVHLEALAAGASYSAGSIILPGPPAQLDIPLEAGWQDDLAATRELGSQWLRAGSSLALQVPSALIPAGMNILLNPAHEDFPPVSEPDWLPFRRDSRLF